MEKKQYNREATKKKILDAVGSLIIKDGIDSLGINAIAREAGVDKVLIYRYFENLDKLLYEYVESKEFYGNAELIKKLPEKIKTVDELKEITKNVFISQYKYISESKELQQILLWELKEENEVTKAIAARREKMGLDLMEYFNGFVKEYDEDLKALIAILTSSVIYLALRSRTAEMFNSVNIRKPDGIERIFSVLGSIIDKYFKGIKLKR